MLMLHPVEFYKHINVYRRPISVLFVYCLQKLLHCLRLIIAQGRRHNLYNLIVFGLF